MLCHIPVFESFILDYMKLFNIGQQQTAECIVLVEFCEKQFCVFRSCDICWYKDAVNCLRVKV